MRLDNAGNRIGSVQQLSRTAALATSSLRNSIGADLLTTSSRTVAVASTLTAMVRWVCIRRSAPAAQTREAPQPQPPSVWWQLSRISAATRRWPDDHQLGRRLGLPASRQRLHRGQCDQRCKRLHGRCGHRRGGWWRASQVSLALSGGATVENVSATGTVNVTVAAGNLAVKTVSGSAVTLSAANGAILDANGAANNITANSGSMQPLRTGLRSAPT
jgi:hypothetical protein